MCLIAREGLYVLLLCLESNWQYSRICWLGGKTRIWDELCCVERAVKTSLRLSFVSVVLLQLVHIVWRGTVRRPVSPCVRGDALTWRRPVHVGRQRLTTTTTTTTTTKLRQFDCMLSSWRDDRGPANRRRPIDSVECLLRISTGESFNFLSVDRAGSALLWLVTPAWRPHATRLD